MYERDISIVQQISKGDEQAFEELVRKYGGIVKSVVYYHLKDISMWQEDCINDVFFKIWQNIDRYNPEKSSLKNWIGAAAKHRAIDYKRKYYKELMAVEIDENMPDGKSHLSESLKAETEEEIQSLLANLKEEDREVFIQYYINEQSVNEISKDKGKEPSWVYNRLSRGRKRLRQLFYNERQG